MSTQVRGGKEVVVKLTQERIPDHEANKDGRAAQVKVLFTNEKFRNDPEVQKELAHRSVVFSARGVPKTAGYYVFDRETEDWKNITLKEIKSYKPSEIMWVTGYAARNARDVETSGNESEVVHVDLTSEGYIAVYTGSAPARVAKIEQTQADVLALGKGDARATPTVLMHEKKT